MAPGADTRGLKAFDRLCQPYCPVIPTLSSSKWSFQVFQSGIRGVLSGLVSSGRLMSHLMAARYLVPGSHAGPPSSRDLHMPVVAPPPRARAMMPSLPSQPVHSDGMTWRQLSSLVINVKAELVSKPFGINFHSVSGMLSCRQTRSVGSDNGYDNEFPRNTG